MDCSYCKSRDSWKALHEPAHNYEKESCIGKITTYGCAPHPPGPHSLQSPDLSFPHFSLMEWSHWPSCIPPILPGVWGRVEFQVFCFFPFSAFDWAENQRTSHFVPIWISHLKSLKLRQVLMSLNWSRKYYSWALIYQGNSYPPALSVPTSFSPPAFPSRAQNCVQNQKYLD